MQSFEQPKIINPIPFADKPASVKDYWQLTSTGISSDFANQLDLTTLGAFPSRLRKGEQPARLVLDTVIGRLTQLPTYSQYVERKFGLAPPSSKVNLRLEDLITNDNRRNVERLDALTELIREEVNKASPQMQDIFAKMQKAGVLIHGEDHFSRTFNLIRNFASSER